ncbi:biopolymer transporter ExbB, partial [Gluconacetobacter entanii]
MIRLHRKHALITSAAFAAMLCVSSPLAALAQDAAPAADAPAVSAPPTDGAGAPSAAAPADAPAAPPADAAA